MAHEIGDDERVADAARMIGTWKCDGCGRTVNVSYAQLAEIGTPLCLECDAEMILLNGVVPTVFEAEIVDAAEPGTALSVPYYLIIGGSEFRSQRELLLKLRDLTDGEAPYSPAPGDQELLEGLIHLTDELADQAHDNYGVDCLLDATDEP
jgi:hypothetical protein